MVTSSDSDLQEKIKAQVEYYFGDVNIRKDKFIRYHCKSNNGWLPMDKLMTFNKLKALTTDAKQVAEAIKGSDLIELSEDSTKLRRLKPVPELTEEEKQEINLRTLHLKGFPKDTTFDQIKEFCNQLGKVDSVQMRRYAKDQKFKGCIMVMFVNLEDAEKVLNGEPVKFNDVELLRENKKQYHERKQKWLVQMKEKAKGDAEASLVETKGAILKVTGLDKETKFTEIKEELSKHSKVAFVSNVSEKGECLVRFSAEDAAKVAFKALQEKAGLSDNEEDSFATEFLTQKEVTFSLVSEEEELGFWREFKAKQKMAGNKKKPWQNNKKRRFDARGDNAHKKSKTGNE